MLGEKLMTRYFGYFFVLCSLAAIVIDQPLTDVEMLYMVGLTLFVALILIWVIEYDARGGML